MEKSNEEAVLRCLGGEWFCPKCLISCSTKGNLKRHIRIRHQAEKLPLPPKITRYENDDRYASCSTVTEADEETEADKETSSTLKEHELEQEPQDLSSLFQHPQCVEGEGMFTDVDALYLKLCALRPKPRSDETGDDSDCSSSASTADDVAWSSEDEEEGAEEEVDSDDDSSKPIFEGSNVSHQEHMLAIMSYAIRHKLNLTQLNDFLHAVKLHCPAGNKCVTSVSALYKEICGEINYIYHDMCEDCHSIFPEAVDVVNCSTPRCSGLRYSGNENEQQKRQRKCYFVSVPLEEQFKDILERTNVWRDIQPRVSEREKDSSIITDIIDGAAYRQHCKPGGVLSNPSNISLILNTDGIPIFKSSSIGIWPVQLAINEIPPKERFLKRNMVLWGIWQGRGKPIMHAFQKPLVLALNELS